MKIEMDEYFLYVIKYICLDSKANTEGTPAGVRNKAKMSTFQYHVDATGGTSQCN